MHQLESLVSLVHFNTGCWGQRSVKQLKLYIIDMC